MTNTNKDLQRAFDVLKAKSAPYTTLFAYYDGNQELKYNSDRFKSIFKNLDADFTENWCSVVIDSTYNRVNLLGIRVAGEEQEKEQGLAGALKRIKERLTGKLDSEQEKLDRLLEDNQVLLESDVVHQVAGVIGESYYIAWQDEEGKVTGFYNDPRLVHLFYDHVNPRKKRYAAKWWVDGEKRRRMILYYPDRLEYYCTAGEDKNVTSSSQFLPCDVDGSIVPMGENTVPNEWDTVPVFQFRPSLRNIKSDIKNTIPIQDAVNKLVSDMMVTSEFAAFKQRWIISNMEIDGTLKNAPNEIWSLPSGDGVGQPTQVGELSASDPDTYLKSLDREIGAISAISQTPQHLFFGSTGGQISGEALIALESPLNDKAQARIDLFTPIWREIISFMLLMSGADIESQNIIADFETPETVQPKTQSEIRKINLDSGIPLVTTLRREGWTQAELDELQVDQEEQKRGEDKTLAQILLEADRQLTNPINAE